MMDQGNFIYPGIGMSERFLQDTNINQILVKKEEEIKGLPSSLIYMISLDVSHTSMFDTLLNSMSRTSLYKQEYSLLLLLSYLTIISRIKTVQCAMQEFHFLVEFRFYIWLGLLVFPISVKIDNEGKLVVSHE